MVSFWSLVGGWRFTGGFRDAFEIQCVAYAIVMLGNEKGWIRSADM